MADRPLNFTDYVNVGVGCLMIASIIIVGRLLWTMNTTPGNRMWAHRHIDTFYSGDIKLLRQDLDAPKQFYGTFKNQYENYLWEQWEKLVFALYISAAVLTVTFSILIFRALYNTFIVNYHLHDFKIAHVTRINFLRNSVECKLALIQKNNWTEYDQNAYEVIILQLKDLGKTFNFETFTLKDYNTLRDQFNEFQRSAAENLDFEFFSEMEDIKILFCFIALKVEKNRKWSERWKKK